MTQEAFVAGTMFAGSGPALLVEHCGDSFQVVVDRDDHSAAAIAIDLGKAAALRDFLNKALPAGTSTG